MAIVATPRPAGETVVTITLRNCDGSAVALRVATARAVNRIFDKFR
jgi:hypothetical protein